MTERMPRILVVLLAAAALTVALAGLRSVAGIVGPAFLALVLTIALHPVRSWLTGRGVPSWLASVLLVLGAYLVLVGLTLALAVSLGQLASLIPQYAGEIEGNVADLTERLGELGVEQAQIDAVVDAFDVGSLVSVVTSLLSGVLGVLSDLFFIVTLLLFMAFDTPSTTRNLDRVRGDRPDLVAALRTFAQGTRSYMGVSAGFGLIVAVVDWVALLLLGVPGAFVWGVLAFVTNFVPNIGFVIGVVPPAVIALLEGGPGLMIAVVVVYSVINVVIQSIIQPRVVGDAVGLTATFTFLSLVFWAWLLGPLGALLAVPLTLLVRAALVDADPGAHWLLPLISGKADEAERVMAKRPPRRRAAGRSPS